MMGVRLRKRGGNARMQVIAIDLLSVNFPFLRNVGSTYLDDAFALELFQNPLDRSSSISASRAKLLVLGRYCGSSIVDCMGIWRIGAGGGLTTHVRVKPKGVY